jgi:hypothetical protein
MPLPLPRWLALSALTAMLAACAHAPVSTAPSTAAAPKPERLALPIACTLQPAPSGFAGSCTVPCEVNALAVNFDGVNSKTACTAGPRSAAMTLAKTDVPGRWLGTMQGVQPEDPTRAELVPNKAGGGWVARLPYGWFAVSQLQESPNGLQLAVDASRQVRPNADDLAIIDRALALVPTTEVWNKNDNRQCPPGQSKLSLFCALMQATTDISGGVHYRQPAMQAVREELNLVDKSRIKTHRIMDFNNHPDTTLAEVHALLKRAKERVKENVR